MRPVVLIDALGTLLELAPPAPRLRAELLRRCAARITDDAARRAMAAEIAFYRAHFDEGRDAASLADLRAACGAVVRDALPELGGIPAAHVRDALLAALHFSPYPDAAPFLSAARSRGARLVVVSNWDVSLHDVLARTGLAALLDGVITSAEVGARKPAPEIFRAALERTGGAAPHEALHVGDSPAEDVEGARAIGIEPVLIVRDGSPAPPGVRAIRRLGDLLSPGGERGAP